MEGLLDRLFGGRRPARREAVKRRIRKRFGGLGLSRPAEQPGAAKPAVEMGAPAQVAPDPEERPAGERLERAVKAGDRLPSARARPVARLLRANMPKHRRALLYLNIGDRAIGDMRRHLRDGGPRPAWAARLGGGTFALGASGRVLFDGLPFATGDQKRDAVKRLYFHPAEPSTILPIAEKLRGRYCNVSKRDVRDVLRSLETYQINLGRRKPQEVKTHTVMRKPGVIAIDAFCPSKAIDGWEGDWRMVLCCMDTWSRYSRAYVCEDKRGETVGRALKRFLTEMASLGHPPRRILADKGTDLGGWRVKELMERYRRPKDGKASMIILAPAGTPVLIVEAMNAQYQRRLAVFRTSGLTSDPSEIMTAISDQLNNQPRRARAGLSPLQLLGLGQRERDVVNARSTDRFVESAEGIRGLRPLRVGHSVRRLLMTRKEQEAPTMKFKGFRPKWSDQLYTVQRVTSARGNPNLKRYHIGTDHAAYRWELQLVRSVDAQVPRQLFKPARDDVVRVGEDWWKPL